MKSVRKLVNFVFSSLLDSAEDPINRKLDLRILQLAGSLMEKVGMPLAQVLKERYILDTLTLIGQSIVRSPYGEPLILDWPLIASISVTSECALHCSYCYSNSSQSSKESISLDLIQKLASTPIPHFIITGGEPLASENISRIITLLLNADKDLHIATNLSSASVKRIEPILRQFPNQITFLISIWGNRMTHDAVRGTGSFERTVELLDYLSSTKSHCLLNCVISDPFFTALDAIENIDTSGVRRIFISRAVQAGRSVEGHLSWDQEFTEKLIDRTSLVMKKLGKQIFMNIPEAAASSVIKTKWMDGLLNVVGIKLPRTCGAGLWMLHVASSGECYPCFGFETKKSYGNLLDCSVSEIWQSMHQHSLTRPPLNACYAEIEQ